MSKTAYMCKNRHGIYYARFVIPKHLQSHFNNKREIRRSLQTDSRKLAIRRARAYRVQFENIVDKLMNNTKSKIEFITFIDLGGITTTIDTGDHLKDAEIYNLIKPGQQAQAPIQSVNPKRLSAYLVDYIKYQTMPGTKDGWNSPTTISKKSGLLDAFIEVCNKPAAAFTWEDAKRYIKIAHAIPPNFRNPTHAKKFVGLTLEMLLDDNIDTSMYIPRKPSAVSMDIKTARAFLEWIRAEELVMELQPAIQVFDNATKRISMESDRRDFTPEELKILFEDDNPSAENYVKGFNSRRSVDANLKYWLPLLGLYTGAAISELCQLHLSDIYEHKAFDGSKHWVIDFNEHAEDDDSRFKTDYRPRLIPVHRVLLDLGLTDYVQALLAKGERELFPSARRYKSESFVLEGQWWGEYSSNAGVTDPNVVFHSFKHGLTTYLDKIHCDRDIVAAFDGHAISTMGKKVYSKGGHRVKDIGPLVEWINKIDYGLKHHRFKLA